jgi:hemerythrin-like domain-containing protein
MPTPARKTERFLHFDSPAGYDDPIGMLLGCHRRIEKKLATLKALSPHLAAKGVDAEASAAAQGVLRYFNASAAYHHEDEEIDLLPLLLERVTDEGDRERLHAMDDRVRDDHREMARTWARVKKPLEGIADGLVRTIPETDVQAFLALNRRHIEAEEGVIVPLAQKWLTGDDLKALGRAMATRRGAPFPS